MSDSVQLRDDARKAAIADATRRAKLYAEAAGVTLGPVQSIDEQSISAPYPKARSMLMAADAPAPVAQGEISLSANVNMVFALID